MSSSRGPGRRAGPGTGGREARAARQSAGRAAPAALAAPVLRDVVYYVASTLDGFIAREDGSSDGFPWDERFGAALMAEFPETFPAHLRPDAGAPVANRHFDAVLMGRGTYEVGLREGVTDPYPTLDSYVFSTTMAESPDPRVKRVSRGAADLVRSLKAEPGKAIWLCGGADLAGRLFAANLVDRLIIKLNPVLFGSGIPLIGPVAAPAALDLTGTRPYPSGHVLLEYDVKHPPSPA